MIVDEGAGPAVVLLHGQPGSGASWRPVVDLLRDDHRVLAPDRPGYGGNRAPATGFPGNARAVVALMEEAGASPAVVVGHSWGGGVAIAMARDHPDAVRGLVLVGSVGVPGSISWVDAMLAAPVMGEAMTAVGMAVMGTVLPWVRRRVSGLPGRWASWCRTTLPDQSVAGGIGEALGRARRSFVVEQRALVDQLEDLAASLAGLDLPVAVLAGSADVVVPPAAAVALAHAIPGASLEMIDGIGHFVPRDAPAAVADAVRRVARN